MSERILVIKEEHLAAVMAEYYKRAAESPEEFYDLPADDFNKAGKDNAAYVFQLAGEMGYINYEAK